MCVKEKNRKGGGAEFFDGMLTMMSSVQPGVHTTGIAVSEGWAILMCFLLLFLIRVRLPESLGWWFYIRFHPRVCASACMGRLEHHLSRIPGIEPGLRSCVQGAGALSHSHLPGEAS